MTPIVKELNAEEIAGLRIGHAETEEGKTGVTVLYFPRGAQVGCHISGGGPASRETPLTFSETADNPVDAIVLSGGSAYGLAASDGVMRCLEKHEIGYATPFCRVPLVCQSCIFDLGYGSAHVRPDFSLGYEACEKALAGTDGRMGNIGGGTGASVGKLYGMKRAMKSGFGFHSVQIGRLQITAAVIVNAFGDIVNPRNGRKIAGLMNENRTDFCDTVMELTGFMEPRDLFAGNTTIGAVITNAAFTKAEMNKIASMAQNAYARCINPVGTMADGDTIYAAAVLSADGEKPVAADINLVGTMAAEAMSEAIHKAILSSEMPDEEFLRYCLG